MWRRLMRLFAALAVCGASVAQAASVWVVELEGAISPASSDYFIRTLERAGDEGVELVVMRLDTPGGLDKSMRDMVKAILASTVPVATYVAPNGSRAASAGTYLMYASHIAAMAPATNIGSSTPVSIGGGGGSPFPSPTPTPSPMPTPGSAPEPETSDEGDEGSEGSADERPPHEPADAMGRKVVNDAAAYLRSLAELRGRNVEWAEETVRSGANLAANEALEQGVIDLVAEDLGDLLAAINGRTVTIAGVERTLDTADAEVQTIEPDWRYELLGIITDPNVAYILLMIGIYALILEFYNPGIGVGAVTGVICLLLGAFALQMLPINYAGLALIAVGVAMLAVEAFTPSFGIVGTGGVIAFVIGSIILMDTDLPGYKVSYPIIAAFTAVSVGVVVFGVGAALRMRRARVTTGVESMVGARAQVMEDFTTSGRVHAFGEVWNARGEGEFHQGEDVEISAVDGVIVQVKRTEPATRTR